MHPECPNCREPVPRMRLFFTTAWGRWPCKACGTLLGVDLRRRFLATIPFAVILILLIKVLRITDLGIPISVPVIIGAGLLNFFIFDRAVVRERTGFRCRRCGYDLRGQTEGRCPECGLDFDFEALTAHRGEPASQPRVVRLRWRIVTGVIVGGLTLLLIAGLMYLRAAKARKAVPPVVAPQPVAPTANPNPVE